MKSINDVPFGNTITYGGDYNTWDYQGDYCNDPTLHSMAGKFPIVYNDPKQTFRLKMATNDMLWSYSKIICQKITYPEPTKIEVPPKMDTFALMAHHNCLRDKTSLLTMSSSIERDIKAITQLDVHYVLITRRLMLVMEIFYLFIFHSLEIMCNVKPM